MPLIEQEISTDRYIDIPEEVQDIYKLYRPTPLIRATRLEKSFGHACSYLFQERECFPLQEVINQIQRFRRRTINKIFWHRSFDNGDWGWTMGFCFGTSWKVLWA